MYSFPSLEQVCCSTSGSKCCFLTCIQVSQEAGQVVWHSHLSQNFPQFIVIHTVKGFGIVNEAEVDVFLELSCFFSAVVWYLEHSLALPFVRKHLIGGFLCAGLDLSWILCSIQELRGVANHSRGWGTHAFPSLVFPYGDKQLFTTLFLFMDHMVKVIIYNPLSLIWIALCFLDNL